MAKKLPWIKWRVSDWLADENVRMMSLAARGLYHDLLMYQAQEGSVPDDPRACARLISADVPEVVGCWDEVRLRFESLGDGRMFQRGMDATRAEVLEFQAEQQRRGALGGRARAEAAAKPPLERGPSRGSGVRSSQLEQDRDGDLDVTLSQEQISISSLLPPRNRDGDRSERDGSGTVGEGAKAAPLFSGEPETVPPQKPTNRTRSPAQVEADAMLDAVIDIVFKHAQPAETRSQWRMKNKRAARQLLDAGVTVEQLKSALRVLYTHPDCASKSHTHYLGVVQSMIPWLRQIRNGGGERRRPQAAVDIR